MKTIKLIAGSHLVNGVHRTPKDPPFAVPDSFANDLVRVGHAEVVGGSVLAHSGFVGGQALGDALADAYSPVGPNDDPTQAARNLGSSVEENAGLIALAASGHPQARTKGRYGPTKPDDDPVTPPAPSVTPAKGGTATPAATPA